MAAIIGDLIVKLALVLVVAAIPVGGYAVIKLGSQILDTRPQYPNQYVLPSPTTVQTPKPSPHTARKTNKFPLIDCTGPDKVVFKTTQKKCDEFNAAWGNAAAKTPTSQQTQSITNSGSGTYVSPYVECTTATGTYSKVTPEMCQQWQAQDLASQYEYERIYTDWFINSAVNQYEYQQQSAQTHQDCINNAENLYNELCADQRKFDPSATCESLYQEKLKSQAQCP